MRLGRPLARDDQEHIGHLAAQTREHANEEINVLLVCHATHEECHWALRIDPVGCSEVGAMTGRETSCRQAGRQDLDRRLHTIRTQRLCHLP